MENKSSLSQLDDNYVCGKCNKSIFIINKFLHDQYCAMEHDEPKESELEDIKNNFEENINELGINSNEKKKEKEIHINDISNTESNQINLNTNYPPLEEILKSNKNQKNNKIDEFKYCKLCDNYFHIEEFEDHMVCHKYEEKSGNFHDIKKNQEQNLENIQDEYDFVDDKDDVIREVEEEQAFQRKIKNKKEERKEENKKITAKNVANYLFDTRRRVPPILRLVGAIFDRNQLLYLAAEEVATRVIDHIDERVHPKRAEDKAILLDLIPEIEITNPSNIPEEKKYCIICMCSFEVGEKITNLPCLHIYHSQCIKDWFKTNSTCPVCKYVNIRSQMKTLNRKKY